MKIARERKSSVLASNAVHHRIDSLTSIVALVTIGGSHVLHNASWLDPVGGLIISVMVVRAGLGNTYTSLLELADVGVDTEIKGSVRRSVNKALTPDPAAADRPGVEGHQEIDIRDVQGLKSGQNYLMEIELAVPGDWSVERTQAVEDAVRTRVGSKVRGVKRVKVRFVSKQKEVDFMNEFIGADVSPRSSPEPEDEGDHNHDHEHEHRPSHGHQHDQEVDGLHKRH